MRNTTTYNIVSNTDTIIFLKNPCLVFAEWGQDMPLEAAREPSISRPLSKKEQKKAKKGKTLCSQNIITHGSVMDTRRLAPVETSLADTGGPSSTSLLLLLERSNGMDQSPLRAGSPKVEQTITRLDQVEPGEIRNSKDPSNIVIPDPHCTEAALRTTVELKEEVEIRFRVCAGNLMSASPWFNRVLEKDGWLESSCNPADKCFHLPAEDWDEEAFVILMNVFHLRNNKVPRTLTLETLAKFAVLADYYECGESVDLFVDMWAADLRIKLPIPTTYCRDLILWIWISWAFKLSDLFKQATAVAITKSAEPVRNLGLPIPAWVTGKCYFGLVS